MNLKFMTSLGFLLAMHMSGSTQVLQLADALQHAVENYDQIKTKQALVQASAQQTIFQQQQYLPDVTVSAQQSFGTINVQHGPMYAYGGLASAATSMPAAEQNWNAAFGSLYFANVNWDLFTFGKLKGQVDVALAKESTAKADLQQEIFQHQVRVSAAYLNLLASQRIKYVQEKNHERAQVFYQMTDSRAKSGLIPEVDASLAKAEVSSAKSQYIKSDDKELAYSKSLAVLMGQDFQRYSLDARMNTSVPQLANGELAAGKGEHPYLALQQSRIAMSEEAEKLTAAFKKPTVSAFGVIQGRGSGFDWNYAQDNSAYSASYFKGVGVDRSNYLLGVSLRWNITDLFRFRSRVKEQQYQTQALQHAYSLADRELQAQAALAKSQVDNAFDNWEETKVQLAAAQLAYKQHTALYENGLTTLVDYTQALYSLNRAEIDFEIAQNNVWQGVLLWAASQGDMEILLASITN